MTGQPVAYIYEADIHCPDCGQYIMDNLSLAGFRPAEPEDETTYDSDEWPKVVFSFEQTEYCGTCGECLFLDDGDGPPRCSDCDRLLPVNDPHAYCAECRALEDDE